MYITLLCSLQLILHNIVNFQKSYNIKPVCVPEQMENSHTNLWGFSRNCYVYTKFLDRVSQYYIYRGNFIYEYLLMIFEWKDPLAFCFIDVLLNLHSYFLTKVRTARNLHNHSKKKNLYVLDTSKSNKNWLLLPTPPNKRLKTSATISGVCYDYNIDRITCTILKIFELK